jgi:hypothetical protein
LDVNHDFNNNSKLETGLFIKPTATNSTYLNPTSYHPNFTSIGILKGEMIRIRKISSSDQKFEAGKNEIIDKAKRSFFSNSVIKSILDTVKEWGPNKRIELLNEKPKEKSSKSVTWVSQIPTCIKTHLPKLRTISKNNIRVAYQKPSNLQQTLFKPRTLEKEDGQCGICGKCMLCGNRNPTKDKKYNMVKTGKHLEITLPTTDNNSNNEISKIPIRAKLDCDSAGIYVAICTRKGCNHTYVGQTAQSFHNRWNQHRRHWVGKTESDTERDDTALLDHYRNFHATTYKRWCSTKTI